MIEVIPNWHPAFVHFPIAFASASVFFFVAAKLVTEEKLAAQYLASGRWMLWGAAIFACIAAVFGWLAFNSVEHDEAGHLAMTAHRNWALGTLGALILLSAWTVWFRRFSVKPTFGFLILLIVGWLLVLSTAWHGAELVYRHGIGVMALPDVHGEHDGIGLVHEHGHEHEHEHAH